MSRKRQIKEVRANRIVLEDLGGRTKAVFDASIDEMVSLHMYHGDRPVLDAGIGPDGTPHITFFNNAGHAVLGLGVSEDLGQGISISDAAGRPVCFILVGSDGIPSIRLLEVTTPTNARVLWSSPKPKKSK